MVRLRLVVDVARQVRAGSVEEERVGVRRHVERAEAPTELDSVEDVQREVVGGQGEARAGRAFDRGLTRGSRAKLDEGFGVLALVFLALAATRDCEVGGKQISAGDQVLMWYVSGNRDREVWGDDADDLDIERADTHKHLSFGYGVHYCVGSRLAELQLKILWDEILPRFERIELVGEPERTFSSFIHGYTKLPVQVTRR